DGRSVEKVNISPFISNLPFQKDTTAFSSENASGSTSQAANIIEALEYGTGLLLIDEDTSATNFMIRDARMQRLVPKEGEPITPFVDQVGNLVRERQVSTIVVVGGSGDYFDVADTVIRMKEYLPAVVTQEAHRIAAEMPTRREIEAPPEFAKIIPRSIVAESLDPYRKGRTKVTARGLYSVQFGEHSIDLSNVEQLVDASQTRAIADIMLYGLRQGHFGPGVPMAAALERIYEDISRGGLDVIAPHAGQRPGDYALPRLQETAQAINRFREIEVRQLR
ncbi:MAG: ABC-ATPase domain-containing protein, partial [Chloroflexi bacterium]|nr:ABC-ATPase domain-containing protein [Chloroflexota bacterium]